MGALMSSHSIFECKALTALLAFRRFLTRVDTLVSCQIEGFRKAFMALLAFKRFLTCVDALMNILSTYLCEALIALLAFKRFLTRVNAFMYCQIGSSRKALMTVRALMGLHKCVDRLVP